MKKELENNEKGLSWYAMRATFRREMTARNLLEAQNVETFIPMREVVRISRGRRVLTEEPAIHNLIFVRWQRDDLQSFKRRVPYLQYLTRREGGRSVPIVIGDREMNSFISVTRHGKGDVEFYDASLPELSNGTRVRINGGMLDGVEGKYVKIKGKRNRRVVISIDNVLAVATAQITADMLEVLE